MLFVELHYTLATEEAERIGVDHVARMSSNDSGESSLGTYNLFTPLNFWSCYIIKKAFKQTQILIYCL